MYEIGKTDLSKVVVFLKEYARTEHHGNTREANKRRLAYVLAKKLQKRLNKKKT